MIDPRKTTDQGGAFAACLAIVVGTEGGYTADPADPGNWTGGRCGAGRCRGTKYGISAGAFPDVDIEALTQVAAAALYRTHYWERVCGDALPGPLALLVFDAAVNAGVERAAAWLQQAAGATPDGRIGPETLRAVAARAGDGAGLCAEFLALRMEYMAGLPGWRTFGRGWARRLARLPYQSMAIAGAVCLALTGGWAWARTWAGPPAMELLSQPNCAGPDVTVPEAFAFCLDNFRKHMMEV